MLGVIGGVRGPSRMRIFFYLVDIVYTMTKIDKTRYDIIIHYVIEFLGNVRGSKVAIMDDYSAKFIMFDEGRYKVIYVDTICKDARVGNLRSQLENQFSSYNGGNKDSTVVVPLAFASSPQGNYDDNDDGDGDNETGDDNGGDDDDDGGANLEYPDVRFPSSQFKDNPLRESWIVFSVENYATDVI